MPSLHQQHDAAATPTHFGGHGGTGGPLLDGRGSDQFDATHRRIDQLVYELYGLTDDEIRIVEEATK